MIFCNLHFTADTSYNQVMILLLIRFLHQQNLKVSLDFYNSANEVVMWFCPQSAITFLRQTNWYLSEVRLNFLILQSTEYMYTNKGEIKHSFCQFQTVHSLSALPSLDFTNWTYFYVWSGTDQISNDNRELSEITKNSWVL